MSEFNFKSQFCTSIEQSKRLLALGLKKETADMIYVEVYCTDGSTEWSASPIMEGLTALDYEDNWLPAWSLGRLIDMIPKNIIVNIDMVFPFRRTALADLIDNDCDLFEGLVQVIERSVKEGYFYNKYLV